MLPSLARAALSALAAFALLCGCASDGGSSGPALDASGGPRPFAAGDAVQGDVMVALRTFQPGHPTVTMAIVNASSEVGRKLESGRATSSQIRVASDEQVGTLLGALDEQGFSANAEPGISLDTVPEDPRRRGVLIVTRDGVSRGILFGTQGFGTRGSQPPVPVVYTESKRIVWGLHSALPGFEVSASTNPADADRLFSAPRIKMQR